MFLQQRTHDIALNSFAFAVDQAHFAITSPLALLEIFFDDARNVFGLKGMEIKGVGQRNGHGFAEGRSRFASEAITFFFLVALRHKKEGKKLFLPSLSVNRNLAVQLIPTFVAFQTAAGFCQRSLDDRNVDEFFVAWLIICFDRA